MTRAVHKWRKETIDQSPPPACSVKRRFFALARENATAPVLTCASRNGNDRFSDNRRRGVTRRNPVLGADESRLLVIIYRRFSRRGEWPAFNFSSIHFFPMGSSVSPSPGAKVNVFAVLRFSEPVFTVSVSTTRRRKPQYRSLRSIYLTLSCVRITRDEDRSRWCLKGFKAPRLQADALTIQLKIRLSAHSVRAKDQCRVVTFQD